MCLVIVKMVCTHLQEWYQPMCVNTPVTSHSRATTQLSTDLESQTDPPDHRSGSSSDNKIVIDFRISV